MSYQHELFTLSSEPLRFLLCWDAVVTSQGAANKGKMAVDDTVNSTVNSIKTLQKKQVPGFSRFKVGLLGF